MRERQPSSPAVLRRQLLKITTDEQGTQKDETSITEDHRNEIVIAEKYMAQGDEVLQLLSEFEDTWNGHLGRI